MCNPSQPCCGHGTVTAGACVCTSGYSGADCATDTSSPHDTVVSEHLFHGSGSAEIGDLVLSGTDVSPATAGENIVLMPTNEAQVHFTSPNGMKSSKWTVDNLHFGSGSTISALESLTDANIAINPTNGLTTFEGAFTRVEGLQLSGRSLAS